MKLTRRTALLLPTLPAWAGPSWAAGPTEPASKLWAASFQTPEGKTLKLSELKGRWWLLNFWATWCAPCIKEMPDFDRFHQDELARGAQGWPVVGLAIDAPTPVRDFLKRRPVRYPIGLAGLNGTELMRSLGNLKGGLPFTVAVDPQGAIAWRRPGETHLAQLRELRGKLAVS